MSPLTTHVLDTAQGRPAKGVSVVVERQSKTGQFKKLGEGKTNSDGRVTDLLTKDQFVAGIYRLTFDTESYHGASGFFPSVTIHFRVKDPKEHHHVPLLLNPFGYSTYRGS